MAKQTVVQKTIHDFLPQKEEKFSIQAKVRKSLYEMADEKRKQEGRTWVEIIEAALQTYVAGVQK